MKRTLLVVPVLSILTALNAHAAVTELEGVTVVGQTPIHGTGIEKSKLAASVQSANSDAIQQSQSRSLSDYMRLNFSGVSINEAQNNPYQPDVQYRGFTASPLLGLPQGMSVYVNGIRFNEPFGDTVNWDLLPQGAIDSVNLFAGSNPVFGQNTLGGALSLRLKNGFDHQGNEVEALVSEHGRRNVQFSSAGNDGRFGYFVIGNYDEEDGWRDFSPSDVRQLLSTLSWRGDDSSLDLTLAANDNKLLGNGASPIDLLDQFGREQVFTHPDQTETKLKLFALSGDRWLDDNTQLAGNLYYRKNEVATFNGDDTDFEACEEAANAGFLCEEEGTEEEIVEDLNGNNVTSTINGEEPEATNNRSNTDTDAFGGALQLALENELAGLDNQLIVGFSYDTAQSDFAADTELAELTDTRGTEGLGVYVDEARVRLHSEVEHYGLFLTDTVDLTDRLSATLSGRYNYSRIVMEDNYGTELNGVHSFSRFNPAAGVAYVLDDGTSVYGSYSESSRAPTPVELSCADPDDPCKLPNAFISDPPLYQVVAKSYEMGIRGESSDLNWNLGLFHTTNHDDILFINGGSLTSEGYFDNVGRTRRQGIEAAFAKSMGDWQFSGSYTYLDATFQTGFIANSPNNPQANANGQIAVEKGDRIPSLPRHNIKLAADWNATQALALGMDVQFNSSQYYRGDEANLNEQVDGYTLANLRATYKANPSVELFARLENVFDSEYETFGVYGESDEVLGAQGIDDDRFVAPGKPRTATVGIRARF